MAKKRKDRKVPGVPVSPKTLRTQDEIVARFKRKREIPLSFEPEVLVAYLDFEHVKPFLKLDTANEKDWPTPLYTRSAVLKQAKTYMRHYGWPKVLDHRGLSASRTVEKMTAWAWLLGEEDLLKKMKKTPYPNYGAPILKVVCEHFGWPIPKDESAKRMMQGLTCSNDCSECG